MKTKYLIALSFIIYSLSFSHAVAQTSAPADFTGHTWYEYREAITVGDGSMDNPYEISTPGQLAQLAYEVNSGENSYKNKVVVLTADINLNKEVDGLRVQWVPIGYNPLNRFNGLFLGMDLKDYATNGFKAEQKHKISGMYINVSSASDAKLFGLFGMLDGNGIFTNGIGLVDVYISDATYGSVLYNEYLDDESWEEYADAGKLHCYYPLKVGSAKAATMYIGFDTELPSGLKAYIVTSNSKEEYRAYLRRMSNQIPNRSPIVIFADEPGTYRLLPLEGSLQPWNMYENQLNGVGRDGMEVYQSDSDRGSILTLGRNSAGTLGFFYYKGTTPIPPYRAYLTYEWATTNASPYLLFSIIDDEPTGIESLTDDQSTKYNEQGKWYTLDGRRINGHPKQRGIYIRDGKKYVVK